MEQQAIDRVLNEGNPIELLIPIEWEGTLADIQEWPETTDKGMIRLRLHDAERTFDRF